MKIDILRLKGKGNDARKLTSSLKDGGADGGRVLAALDLIESSPNYRKVIDRLRAATKSERKLGRAHAMLIYALARSGEAGDAQKELDALAAQNENFPLLDPLKRYVEDTEDRKDEDAKGSDEIPEDYREALKRATAARKVGDLDRAERLYRAALAKKPGNSEALAGLAAIERDRGDAGGAEKRYKDMLAKNPNYIPAMIGLADMKWASGNRSEAISIYRQVVKSAPGTDWATHAQARIDEGAAAPASSAPSPATGPKPPPPSGHPAPEQPSASAAPDVPPHVDVTDLPEYQ